MTIRAAQPADAAALIDFVQDLAAEPNADIALSPGEFTLTVEQERAILEEYAAAENSVYLVAECEQEIVGILNCKGGTRRATRHTTILSMSIRANRRNQGVGSALLARAVAWAEASTVVKRIELAVFARNAAARHLYEKFGFEVEGRRQRALFRDGAYHDDLIMARLL